MSVSNIDSPTLPTVVESTLSAVLIDTTAPVVIIPKVFVPDWKKTGRRTDGKQVALTNEASVPSTRKPPVVSVRFCRFEDHYYDREAKTWIPSVDGALRMCPDRDCTFTHRIQRPITCPTGDECSDHQCKLLHSKQRKKPCRFGENCINGKCGFSHPATHRQPCPFGANCYEHAYEKQRGEDDEPGLGCPNGHPSRMTKICRHDRNCKRFECNFLHQTGAPIDCPDGAQCQLQWQRDRSIPVDEICQNKHPHFTRVLGDSNGNFRFM